MKNNQVKKWSVILLVFIGGYVLGFTTFSPVMRGWWEYKQSQRNKKFMNAPMPDIGTTTLDGDKWKLSDHKGKVILIDFWATWCGPCIAAMPEMKKIYEAYGNRDDFLMVGVSLDDDRKAVTKFVEDKKISWLQLFEDKKGWMNYFARKFNVMSIPSVWVIDKNGIIRGANMYDKKNITAIIDQSL